MKLKFEDFTPEQRLKIAEFVYSYDSDILIKTDAIELVDVLLEKENAYIPVDISKEDLQFKSPEELDGEERNLTTPFWTIGVMLYQAKFGKHPF